MTDCPLVSILVANYNNGCFIAETLQSAVEQTYPNCEIVIIDDGSEDDSLQVIERFMDSHPDTKIKLVKNHDPKGCGRIKRQCVELSEGDYFCFLDPEDTIVPEAISTLMDVFKCHKELGVVYCTHYLCNEKLEPQRVSDYPGLIPDGQSHLTSTGGHISALAVCSRQIYNKTTGINATYYVAEDQDLYLKMEEQAPVFYVDIPLYYYRKHNHNSSWSEQKVFDNFYWKYICERAAFLRRKKQKTLVDNLSQHEMNQRTLSFHYRLAKQQWKDGRYFAAMGNGFRMLFCWL